MTVPVWPDELPRPERSSWQLSPMDARNSRDPQAGPPASRRGFSGVPDLVSLSVLLTADQRAMFWNFWRNDTKQGSLPFRMANPTMDGWALATGDGAPLLTADDAPLVIAAEWLCMFGTGRTPSETIKGVKFRVTFDVVVMP